MEEKNSTWISIKTPPTEDGNYIVAMRNGDKWHITVRKYKKDAVWPESNWSKNTFGVRYWMPVPPDPEGD